MQTEVVFVFDVVMCEGVVRTGAVLRMCAQPIENILFGKAFFTRSRSIPLWYCTVSAFVKLSIFSLK